MKIGYHKIVEIISESTGRLGYMPYHGMRAKIVRDGSDKVELADIKFFQRIDVLDAKRTSIIKSGSKVSVKVVDGICSGCTCMDCTNGCLATCPNCDSGNKLMSECQRHTTADATSTAPKVKTELPKIHNSVEWTKDVVYKVYCKDDLDSLPLHILKDMRDYIDEFIDKKSKTEEGRLCDRKRHTPRRL